MGDYASKKHAVLTLTEFEDWLPLAVCRDHNTRHEALGRTGITLLGVHDWSDAFASLVGRCCGKMQVRHDPVNLPLVWLLVDDGRMIPPQYRYLGHPRITPIGVAVQVSLT